MPNVRDDSLPRRRRRSWSRVVRDFFAPRSRRVDFVVLSFDVPYGVTADSGYAVRDVLNAENPDDWVFLNPASFLAYFSSEAGGLARAARCRAALVTIQTLHESLRGMRFGQAEGTLMATFDRRGRLCGQPIGQAIIDAVRSRVPS